MSRVIVHVKERGVAGSLFLYLRIFSYIQL